MCSNETDIHDLVSVIDPDDQPVFVAGNVENHPAIPKNTGIA
jgi:hypothetical protein